MEDQSSFERQTRERLDKLESAISALVRRMDGAERSGSTMRPAADLAGDPGRPFMRGAAEPRVPLPNPKPHTGPRSPAIPAHGADWWLARAGAALTCVAVILLYQYAVGHGWITPVVRVLTGVAIGSALMYWGRKMPPADDEDGQPVALRELMMGAALATWYISAYAASVSYSLISVSTSRLLFLVLSITGAVLALRERRSLLAIVAISVGFLAPVVLPSSSPSIPAFAIYLAAIGGLAALLYLMRGWQSVLWISFFALCGSISGAVYITLHGSAAFPNPPTVPFTDLGRISMTILVIAVGAAFTRAPSLRRGLVATGSDRYPEPIRSSFAKSWLKESGRLLKLFSPAAGQSDSISLWVITIAAPIAAVGLLSALWPAVSDSAWASIDAAIGVVALRACASASDENSEITHLKGAGAFIWLTAGLILMGRAFLPTGSEGDALTLGVAVTTAIATILVLRETRYIAARSVARAVSVAGVVYALMAEASLMNMTFAGVDRVRIAMTLAEAIAIVAGFVAWRDIRQSASSKDAANLVAVLSYAAFLALDARVLGEIWKPLVTASFAVAGTTILVLGRKRDEKMQQAVGGATLALVVFRLFFVDLAGVDTLWRVLLFLGVGALFLFTSRKLQTSRPIVSPEST